MYTHILQVRDELAALDLIEITRALQTNLGDEIDVQLAIFDQARA